MRPPINRGCICGQQGRLKHLPGCPKSAAKPRVRKPKAPAQSEFVARFHENLRAAFECTCEFPDSCDGSRLIHCLEYSTTNGSKCDCPACPEDTAEHVTGCAGCEQCLAAVCAGCGKRDVAVRAVEGESWTCSQECTRKTLTVTS